jgi:transposase
MNEFPTTIEECHQVIRTLLNMLNDLSKRFDILEAENKQLRIENMQLKERLNNNTLNSSLPLSKSFKKK